MSLIDEANKWLEGENQDCNPVTLVEDLIIGLEAKDKLLSGCKFSLGVQHKINGKYKDIVEAAKILSASDTWDVANTDEWNNLDKALEALNKQD